jgi:phosphotransferase system IIB component
LAQELGGMSAGRAMSSFYQAIVGGRIKEQSVKEMEKLGLINEDKVVRTKTGSIKGLLPGGVKGWELAAHDPYAWTNEVLLPALKAHGITSKEEIQAVIGTMFQQATAAQMVGIFATQQARIEKDWRLVEGSKGLEAADIYQGKDPFIAMQGVTEQFKNLLAIAGGPMAEPAAKGLNAIAGGIVALEEAATKHPVAAGAGLIAGVGALGAGSLAASLWALRGLFGLGKSLASAGATAAEDLSGSAAIKAMQEALPEAAANAGPSFLGTMLGSAAMRYGLGPLGILLGSTREANKGEPQWPIPPQLTLEDVHAAVAQAAAAGVLPAGGAIPSEGMMPRFTTRDVRSAVEPAVAEVKGSADLNVNVQVEPSDSFVSRIISAIRNEINVFGGAVGTAGSTGLSMPEAVPGP